MRAFMSGWGEQRWREPGGAAAAEREARRILAETEPRCDCAFDHLYGRCSGSAVDLDAVRAYVGEREALADALRAFVEGD